MFVISPAGVLSALAVSLNVEHMVPAAVKNLPHNRPDELHHNLIQDVEKLQHQFGLFSHFPHNDSKSDKESNQTCEMQNEVTLH